MSNISLPDRIYINSNRHFVWPLEWIPYPEGMICSGTHSDSFGKKVATPEELWTYLHEVYEAGKVAWANQPKPTPYTLRPRQSSSQATDLRNKIKIDLS